jgi:hypothetical protein
MRANSSSPLDSLSSAAGTSFEKDAAVASFRDLDVRNAAISPLVLRIDPVERSSTILALTPGFLVTRPSFSSRASSPFA